MDVYSTLPDDVESVLKIPETTGRRPPIESAEGRQRTAQCDLVLKYLQKVIVHVVQYDSLETATTILGKAIGICPSLEARVELVKANRLIRAAMKAETWLKSRRRKRHVDATTRNRNLDRFQDTLAEAILLLETESKRSSSSLIAHINSQFETDLPLTLPDTQKFMVKQVPIVVMLREGRTIPKTIPHMQIDTRLYLLQNAYVIGLNTALVKNKQFERVSAVAQNKYGCTLYATALRRPSSNIQWYLLLDFGVEITYAGFVDYLEVDTANNIAEDRIKTARIRDIRLAFEHEHWTILQQIRAWRIELDNAKDSVMRNTVAFAELTALSESDNGLTIKEYGKLRDKLQGHKEKLLRSGAHVVVAQRDTLYQRLAARTAYYDTLWYTARAQALRRQIKFLRMDYEERRNQRAIDMGMIGTRELLDMDGERAV